MFARVMERSLHQDFIACYVTSILEMRWCVLATGTVGLLASIEL